MRKGIAMSRPLCGRWRQASVCVLLLVSLVHNSSAAGLHRRGKPPLHSSKVLRWTPPSKAERKRIQEEGERGLQETLEIPPEGDPSCPCVAVDSLPPITYNDLDEDSQNTVGNGVDFSTFGYQCLAHDQESNTLSCRGCNTGGDCPDWCNKVWCYIDPENCSLHKTRSNGYSAEVSVRYYSYATCRGMDAFTSAVRVQALKGKTFRVGINHHPGGWSGAYHSEGKQYEGPIEKWSGPIVDFFRTAAEIGGFEMELMAPPEFLRNRSIATLGANFFDECVYATTLGYLDFCIGTYAATNTRVLVTDFAILAQSTYYLVLKGEIPGTTFQEWRSSMGTIFQPFETPVWYFIVFFVIPVMGVLFLVHEYNKTGSLYPKSTFVVVSHKDSPVEEIQERKIPIYRHMIHSVYVSFLSVLQYGYDNPIITKGGRIHLIGFAFFILTLLAVYTANLAAILQFQVYKEKVDSLESAVKEAYTICALRELVFVTLQSYPKINPQNFIPDPIDGLPGFASPGIDRQARILTYVDAEKAEKESSLPYNQRTHCHGSLGFKQDLEVEWANGKHCDKVLVGEPVGALSVGVPLFEGISKSMMTLLFKLKNDGLILKMLSLSQPQSTCTKVAVADEATNYQQGGQGKPLTVPELSGIWFISFGFAIVGLLITCFTYWIPQRGNTKVRSLYRHDQHGERLNRLERHDDWFTEDDDMKVTVDHRGRLRSHSSKSGSNSGSRSISGSRSGGMSVSSSSGTKRATFENHFKQKRMVRVMTEKMQAEYSIPESAMRSFPVPEAQFQDSYTSTTDSNDSSDDKSIKFEDMFADEGVNTTKDDAVRKRKKKGANKKKKKNAQTHDFVRQPGASVV